MYTKTELIDQAKSAEAGIMGTHVPHISTFFGEFADRLGLNHDTYYHLSKYIKGVDYAAKRHVFEALGFQVRFLTLSAMKVSKFLRDEGIDTPSIDQAFLDGKRNVFIFEVEQGMTDSLYFVLEYAVDGDPLCTHTVDPEELKREMELDTAAKNFMASIRAKRKAREAAGETDDHPFA